MHSPYVRMHRLFRRLQQKNRFIGPGAHTGLTPAETHFLLELDAHSERSISDLGSLLGVDLSFGSRLAQGLVKKRLLASAPSRNDARRKRLSITTQGKALIQKIDQTADARYRSFAAGLSKSEEGQLVELFRLIADGYGHPTGVRRRNELEYRVEQRRITRCFELLGEHVFGSSLTSSSWQLLAEVVLTPVAPQPTELADLLWLAQNSLSSILTSMEKQRLIRREQRANDKRSFSVHALSPGVRLYEEIEQRAAASLKKSLSQLSAQAIERHVRVLEKFIDTNNPVLPPLAPQYEVRALKKEQERAAARAFAARMLLNEGWGNFLPEKFIAHNEQTYVLTRHAQNQALICFGNSSQPKIAFAAWHSDISPWVMLAFVGKAFQAIGEDFEMGRVEFEPLRSYFGVG